MAESPCPVSCCAEIISGKWTLLVIRDLSEGARRFCELERSLEGISPRTPPSPDYANPLRFITPGQPNEKREGATCYLPVLQPHLHRRTGRRPGEACAPCRILSSAKRSRRWPSTPPG